MVFIKSYKGQNWLLPPSIEEMIPKDHVCYLVESLVESLDFSKFEAIYAGPGHPAYHPRVLLKVLVMGVMDRVRSSRRLARNVRENLVYIYLAEKLTPDFRTISDFRKQNPTLLKEVFKHTVTLAKEEGLLDLSHLSTDGSKQKANAANKRILTKNELDFLLKFVDDELEKWALQDGLEDEAFGELRGSDQLPGSSKKKMQKTVQYYIKKIKEKGNVFKEDILGKLKQAHEEVKKQGLEKVSITDPESRYMKNKKNKIEFSYNTQITVDKKGFIIANDVCQDTNDTKQLRPQILQSEENLRSLPENVQWSFDNNYFEGTNIKFLLDKKIDGYIPDNEKNKENPYDKKHFTYLPKKDEYVCPANQPVLFNGEQFDKHKQKKIRIYKAKACAICPHQTRCTTRKDGIRYIKSYPYEVERGTMTAKMNTPQAKETYKLRAQTVETVIGDIKENKGMSTFLTRGLKTAKTEFNLVCASTNLKKIWLHLQKERKARRNYLSNITSYKLPI
jgi:transposase